MSFNHSPCDKTKAYLHKRKTTKENHEFFMIIPIKDNENNEDKNQR